VGPEDLNGRSAHRPAGPRTLSIDEVHIRKGKDFAVNSDHDRHRAVVELLDVRSRRRYGA
jgi:hypothetical protein